MCFKCGKGPSIKDVRKGEGFGRMQTNAERGGVKDLTFVRKLVLFLLFLHVMQTLPMGDAY